MYVVVVVVNFIQLIDQHDQVLMWECKVGDFNMGVFGIDSASHFAYLYDALKVCTLFVKKKYILLSV